MASGHPSIDTGFEKGGPTICLRSASCRRSTVTSSACSPTGKTIIGERGSWREIGNKIVARGFTFRPNHLKLPSPPKHSRMPMGRAVEHRWYGDVAPWSEEQLEQYCRDMGFSPLQPEENVPTPHDDVGDISLRTDTQCGVFDNTRLAMKEAAN
jgi:hypothetical protein